MADKKKSHGQRQKSTKRFITRRTDDHSDITLEYISYRTHVCHNRTHYGFHCLIYTDANSKGNKKQQKVILSFMLDGNSNRAGKRNYKQLELTMVTLQLNG